MPLSVSPDPLTAGGTATITFGPTGSQTGSVTVDIDDGSGHQTTVEIPLDGNGYGQKTWTVPSWSEAHFNAPGCEEVTVLINQPDPPDPPQG